MSIPFDQPGDKRRRKRLKGLTFQNGERNGNDREPLFESGEHIFICIFRFLTAIVPSEDQTLDKF